MREEESRTTSINLRSIRVYLDRGRAGRQLEEETRQRSSNGGELKLLPVVGVTMAEVSPLIAVLAAGRAAPVWRPPMGEM